MGRQSARMFFNGKDHKEAFFNGHYHRAMVINGETVWEKREGGATELLSRSIEGYDVSCSFMERGSAVYAALSWRDIYIISGDHAEAVTGEYSWHSPYYENPLAKSSGSRFVQFYTDCQATSSGILAGALYDVDTKGYLELRIEKGVSDADGKVYGLYGSSSWQMYLPGDKGRELAKDKGHYFLPIAVAGMIRLTNGSVCRNQYISAPEGKKGAYLQGLLAGETYDTGKRYESFCNRDTDGVLIGLYNTGAGYQIKVLQTEGGIIQASSLLCDIAGAVLGELAFLSSVNGNILATSGDMKRTVVVPPTGESFETDTPFRTSPVRWLEDKKVYATMTIENGSIYLYRSDDLREWREQKVCGYDGTVLNNWHRCQDKVLLSIQTGVLYGERSIKVVALDSKTVFG